MFMGLSIANEVTGRREFSWMMGRETVLGSTIMRDEEYSQSVILEKGQSICTWIYIDRGMILACL